MSPRKPLHIKQVSRSSNNILSPISNASNNHTATHSSAQTIASHPPSPHSSISSFSSFRITHSNLPRLQIPHDPSKMVGQVSKTKRKLDDSPEPLPHLYETDPKVLRRDVAVQVGNASDDSQVQLVEMYHELNSGLHQEIAEIKEEQQEWKVMVEHLINDNMSCQQRIQQYKALMRKHNIPEDEWP